MDETKLLVFLVLFLLRPTEESQLLDQLSFIYKDTYVVYGIGRRTERELPECKGPYEACSLAHTRPWLRPITERFCRCPRRIQCPLHYEEAKLANNQHVSNRAQLKFCEEFESLKNCLGKSPAMELTQQWQTGSKDLPEAPTGSKTPDQMEGFLTRSSLFCNCPWPNTYLLNKTTDVDAKTTAFIYTCEPLPRCHTWDVCGYVRKDTYEMYYTCSCPENHVCDFKRPFAVADAAAAQLAIPFFIGRSFEAVCTKQS